MNFINVIHDSRQQDRYDLLIKELKRQGIIDYTIWPCVLQPTVIASINTSHKAIVKQAQEKGLSAVAIFEDDVFFPHEKGWQKFIADMPEKYDIYMAGSYGFIEPDHTIRCPIGLHCYIISARFYNQFLSVPDDKHIDTCLEGLGNFQVCYPMVALQREGFSANNNGPANYNTILKKEDVYADLGTGFTLGATYP